MIIQEIILYFLFVFSTISESMVLTRFSLKQSLNVPAIKMLGDIMKKPSLAVPDIELNRLSDLDLNSLKNNGIKCIVFDKDNTLCYSFTDELHPTVSETIGKVRQLFSKSGLAILSNSVGTTDDLNYEGARITEKRLNIPVIRHVHKKPGCIDEVLEHFRLSNPDIKPQEICMIGDRLLTDVVFANQNKMRSVLVKPLDNLKDHPVAVVMRTFEVFVLLPILKLCGASKSSDVNK